VSAQTVTVHVPKDAEIRARSCGYYLEVQVGAVTLRLAPHDLSGMAPLMRALGGAAALWEADRIEIDSAVRRMEASRAP
jgi:hypothetical protein